MLPFIESIEGCEEYIAKYMEGRQLRLTDKRQVRQTARHEKRLESAIEESKNKNKLLKYRISQENYSKCDNKFTNNLHFFNGNGSRLGELPRKPFYAFDFAENTSLNRTEFTEHLQNLQTNQSNVTEKWLNSVNQQNGRRFRSNSAPNIRYPSLKIREENDRFSMGRSEWCKSCHEIYNIDENFEIPSRLRTVAFSRWLTISFESLSDQIEPRNLRVGCQPIISILFSTIDNYLYALLPTSPEYVRQFSKYWERQLKIFNVKPNQQRDQWQKKNCIIFLEEFEEDGTQFRRARHIFHLDGEKEDWFIEMDTGKLRCLKNAGPNNVMRMSVKFCDEPCNILECRFDEKLKIGEFQFPREIDKIRKDGRFRIVGFDRMKLSFSSRHIFSAKKPIIKTAIIEPIPSPPAHSMTTVFCDNSSCMGCNTLSAFNNRI
ncbi:unnamed protein product [Caenorhabditis angaria]|uniref:Uncharacterized protein n=1 Tax=Caenorhabditis angaria TaxID=860376 RepID=A0A9P1N1G7_9PELO|nr:unnamed protein product [Caenorhabditis angaria]